MSATVAVDASGCKHMFGTALDFEHAFDEPSCMHRTYVRRRLVVVMTAIGFMFVVGGQAARGLAADPLEPVASRTYVVRPGDTLWSIAARLEPDRDPRAVILELERLNASATDGLVPGRSLSIPPSS